mmetsp:Transcript_5659/g.16358  ORF Transcript_5659/g.16358 Transcript_5659/m.16358 type:complete len:151 (+) Transcript_5659:317-769(+)
MTTSTLYIEEVTDDESDGFANVSKEICENCDGEEHIALTVEPFNEDAVERADITTVEKWICSEHAPCPYAVGGGSTLTNVDGRLYTFGGCDRRGIPSSRLAYYDSGLFIIYSLTLMLLLLPAFVELVLMMLSTSVCYSLHNPKTVPYLWY